MKTLITMGTLLLVLPILQLPVPPVPPPPPPVPQRGAFPAGAQPAPLSAAECKCSIDVTVKRQSNGAPISDAEVTISLNSQVNTARGTRGPSSQPQSVLTGKTDESGRANFPNLAEGTYSITVRREGFFGPSISGSPTSMRASANIGPAAADAAARIRALTAAGVANPSAANVVRQPVQHVAVIMIEGGIISGRVQDANQKPVVDVRISPFQISYQNGDRVLRQVAGQVLTDDLGQYRLFWFPPGEYYLATTLPVAAVARGGAPNFPSPTYYPGTLDPERARPVVVPEGQEVSNTDFELQAGGGVTISGTVTNTLQGRLNPNGVVVRTISSYFLVPRNSTLIEAPRVISNAAVTGARGATGADATAFPFEIRGVPPGSYDFYPIFNDGATPRANVDTGHVALEVGTENISGIQSVIQPGVDLKIQVSVIGGPPPGIDELVPPAGLFAQDKGIWIHAVRNLPSVLTNGLFVSLRADEETFTLTNLPEARFFLTEIGGWPADSYVSDIRQGSRSLMEDTIFNVGKESPESLEVIISRGGATLSGSLEDSKHQLVIGARVFLVPDIPRRRNLLLYKSTTSMEKGVFRFLGVAPGTYRVLAWDSIPQGAEQNDEFMSRYEGSGTRVVVNSGTPLANVRATLIPGNR